MSDTKFTPGPWSCTKAAPSGDRGIYAAGTGIFAEAYADIRRAGENNAAEAEANAHLIAAAPDLYAALLVAELASEELCQGQDPANECWVTLATIRSALAKAQGEA